MAKNEMARAVMLRPSFHQRLGAKRDVPEREPAALPRGNVDFVANISILDQITLVPKTDRTWTLSDFAFGSQLTLLYDGKGLVAYKKQCRGTNINFAGGEGIL